MSYRFGFALLMSTWLALPATAADNERGRPLVQRFSAKEYRAHYQVWTATQAADGAMWFGSQGAVLEYDGHDWRKWEVPTPFVRQTTFGPDGNLYVGGEEAFGVIEKQPDGRYAFRSLLDRLPADARPVGLPRRIVATDDAIYAGTDRSVLRWRNGEMKVWNFPPERRNVVDVINGAVFLIRGAEGIYRLEGETFQPFAQPVELKTAQFTFLLPPPRGTSALAILCLGRDGLFLLDANGTTRPWPHSAVEELKPLQTFSGRQLRNGSYALGTIGGGVFVLDGDGSTHRRFAPPEGLTHDTVIGLGEDREGGLWAGTQNGINRIELSTPATVFDENNGFGDGILLDLVRHERVLYASFDRKLLRLIPASPGVPAHWEADPRIPAEALVTRIGAHPQGLLVSTQNLLVLRGDQTESILELKGKSVSSFAASVSDPMRVFVGYDTTVGSIIWRDGQWIDEGMIPGVDGVPHTMHEDSDGSLWVATDARGVFRIRRAAADAPWSQAEVKRFFESDGLPAGHGWMFVWRGPFGTAFSSETGNYRFEAGTQRFVAEDRLVIDGRRSGYIVEPLDAEGGTDVWWSAAALKRPEPVFPLLRGTWDATRKELHFTPAPVGISSILGISGAQLILSEPTDGVLWVKGMDSLVRIETENIGRRPLAWKPMLREFSAEGRIQRVSPDRPTRLSFSTEPIVFTYSAGLFQRGAAPQFQTRLTGFRDEWSEFSAKREAVFTNLSGGPFAFEVRGKDADGRLSEIASITFSIAPPWHLSPAAYFSYILLGLGTVLGLVRWRTAASERERRRLELIVTERTAQLKVAKEQADTANQAKSAFLANMSHELRTPLNGVIGYAQVLMKDRELSDQNRERLRIVQSSGEHLLRMINEVLDFSKIEAGKLELITAPFHLPQLLRDIAAAASARAEQKELEFVVDAAPDLPDLVLGDPSKLRQVIDNLLGNAIKFTRSGRVQLRAQVVSPETIEFSVTDTGAGIAESDLPRLFKPFQQAVDGRPPEPGTGLGLAISQRLVGLMGGALAVQSKLGAGSQFHFTLKLPVIAHDSDARRSTSSIITGYHGPRRRLLVVDDVAINRHLIRDLLTPLDFTVIEAANGEEALRLVAEQTFDAVFLDLRMAGMDGFEVALRLRALRGTGVPPVDQHGRDARATIKVIAMSASVLSFNREKAFAAGCDDFLPKPFREDDLLARLGLALQLEWIGDSARTSNSRSPFGKPTTRLPAHILERLLAMARRGEIGPLRRSLEELHGDPLVESLSAFARDYRMVSIRELLEAHLAQSQPPPADAKASDPTPRRA